MPASRSPKRTPEPARRPYGRLIGIAVVAALGFVIAFLPASLALRFLPADMSVTEAGGTLWHGSFTGLGLKGRPAGDVEWRLHPLPLLTGRLSATARWVNQDMTLDAEITASRSQVALHAVHGEGAVQSFADLGLTRGWEGRVQVALDDFSIKDRRITAAAGRIGFSHLQSAQFANADLGGVEVVFGPDAVQADGSATASVRDTGSGPLELAGTVSAQPAQGTATLSGTVKERGPMPPALTGQLQNLAQMRGRDAAGRIPLDIEFSI